MEQGLPGLSPEGSDAKPSFRRPSNDAVNRKYRRHSPDDGSDSSLPGSPRRDHNPASDDRLRSSDDRRRRDEGRDLERDSSRNRSSRGDFHTHFDRHTQGNSYNSGRFDDYNRDNKGENENSDRKSSISGQESKSGAHSDYSRLNRHYGTHKERDVDKYSKDKYENYRGKDKEREMMRETDRVYSGSRQLTSSWNTSRAENKSRYKDRDARDDRKHRNEESREHSTFGKEGDARMKDPHRCSNKEMNVQRDDAVQKRKQDEAANEKGREKYNREEEEKQSKIRTTLSCRGKDGSAEFVSGNQNPTGKKLKVVRSEDDSSIPSSKNVLETTQKDASECSTVPSRDVDITKDLNAAKVKAMQAAALVNRNLVGGGYMSTDQKKKLLWGNKKSNATEESSNRWDLNIFEDRDRQEKFNKLMGVKGDINMEQRPSNKTEQNMEQRPSNKTEQNMEQLQIDLEKQYTAGLRRRDGRTVGLGL